MITLKELALTVMRKWKLIASIVFTVTAAVALFSLFIIRPSYLCETRIRLSVPDKIQTEAGEYLIYPVSGNDYMDYLFDDSLCRMTIRDLDLDTTAEDFAETIQYSFQGSNRKTTDGPLTVNIEFTGRDPAVLAETANTHTAYFMEYVKVNVKKIAISRLLTQCIANSDTYQSSLEARNFKYDEIAPVLQDTPKVIRVDGADAINPAYEALETEIAALKMEIADLESMIDMNDRMIRRFNSELQNIGEYMTTFDPSKMDAGFMNILDRNAEVIKNAVLPESPESPKVLRNVVVAFFLSAIAGALLVLTMNYWKKF